MSEPSPIQPADSLASLGQAHPDSRVVIPAATKRPQPVLSAIGMSVAEYKRVQWFCHAAEGVTPDDILKPEYWAHVAQKLNINTGFDRIEVLANDGSWMAELLVLTTGRTAAKVKMLALHDLDGAYADMSNANKTHDIKHRGPRKWSIVRLSDGAVVKENIPTREDAELELADYMKALGA